MVVIIDSPLKQIRRLGWLKRLEFIPLPVWITWQFIKTYKNQTIYFKWPPCFELYTPVKNLFRHREQNNVSNFSIVEQNTNMMKEIWFIECHLRADLTSHGHHIGHEAQYGGLSLRCHRVTVYWDIKIRRTSECKCRLDSSKVKLSHSNYSHSCSRSF